MRRSLAAFGLLLSACYTDSDGISPPLDQIYFPVGLTTDCDRRFEPDCWSKHLYVASSDFDLQYNSGSIQAIRLDGVRQLIETPPTCANDDKPELCKPLSETPNEGVCKRLGVGLEPQTPAERMLYPGPCKPFDINKPFDVNKAHDGDSPKPLLFASVGIGAFASDMVLRYGPELQKRLLVPVRGEASLHWIDLAADGSLRCEQSGATPMCARNHRVGTVTTDNLRELKMPPEPFGIATSDAGDAIVVTHQTRGELSLFTQDLGKWELGPKLEYVHGLPASGAVAIAAAPESQYVRKKRNEWLKSVNDLLLQYEKMNESVVDVRIEPDPYPPGFLVGYRNSARLDLVRYFGDDKSEPTRPFLQTVQSIPLTANAVDTDSRGIAYDDSVRLAREKQCDSLGDEAERTQCLLHASTTPVGAYVSNRSPPSLLVGSADPVVTESMGTGRPVFSDLPSKDVPRIDEVLDMPTGASRVYVGKVINSDGKLETRIFVVGYDQRQIAIYDPNGRTPETFVKTGRGPHAMAFDYDDVDSAGDGRTIHALAYVGHFLDSYLGVIQLDRRNLRTYGTIVLSLAQPVAPRASK